MARVVALGDAHLGRQYYSRTTPDGANQRERDFEESFEAAVDLTLSLEPEVVLWLGDVFDHPRPGYRAYRVAQRAMGKIRAHGAPLVAISGNHDTPRLPGTGSPYAPLADTFPEFHLAYDGTYRAFDLPGVRIHAVPQMLTVDESLAGLDAACRVTDLPTRDAIGDRWARFLTRQDLTGYDPERLLALGDDLIGAAIDEASG